MGDQPQAQTKEYNCGPTALSYFLALQGHMYSPSMLEQFLQPTPELGTDPRAIEQFLLDTQIHFRIYDTLEGVRLPALVNVNHELDGDHYMVVVKKGPDNNVTLWDPYYAELKYWPADYFRMMHDSPLKELKGWTLVITS